MKSIFIRKHFSNSLLFIDCINVPANGDFQQSFENKALSYCSQNDKLYLVRSDSLSSTEFLSWTAHSKEVEDLISGGWELSSVLISEDRQTLYANFRYAGFVRQELVLNDAFWSRLVFPHLTMPECSLDRSLAALAEKLERMLLEFGDEQVAA